MDGSGSSAKEGQRSSTARGRGSGVGGPGFRRASYRLIHQVPEIYEVSGCATHPPPSPLLDRHHHRLQHRERGEEVELQQELGLGGGKSKSSPVSSPLRCVVPPLVNHEHQPGMAPVPPPPPLSLTIRGVNFPILNHEENGLEVEWSIELLESEYRPGKEKELPPLKLEAGGRKAAASAAEGEEEGEMPPFLPQRHLSCTPVVQSSIFPSQLLTCELPSVSVEFFSLNVPSSHTHTLSSSVLDFSSVWMDVFLVKRHVNPPEWGSRRERGGAGTKKYKEGDGGEVVVVRRHAIEMIPGGHSPSDEEDDHNNNNKNNSNNNKTKREEDIAPLSSDASRFARRGKDEENLSGAVKISIKDKDVHTSTSYLSSMNTLSPLERVEEIYRGGRDVWTKLGIGGLHTPLHTLLRRVFLSRLPSVRNVANSLSLQHVRGVILHGPSGTGKTLIARTLVDILGPSAQLTIIHSTDILSKFVGESEKRLKELFSPSSGTPWDLEEDDDDDHTAGNDGEKISNKYFSSLRVIVIDELETLFVRRGGGDGSSATLLYEGVTNTLLSMLNGMHSSDETENILVIGITNRVEALDPALLRPGRFEVLLEIPAPDRRGLEEIFFIHTATLRKEGYLGSDVSLPEMAAEMSGFTGAEVAGVVRAATSLAMDSHVHRLDHPTPTEEEPSHKSKNKKEEGFLVRRQHFQKSIEELRYSAARDEDAYHCWAPPPPPPSPPALQGVFPLHCLRSEADCRTTTTSLVDYTGHLMNRLTLVETFWKSLHPLRESQGHLVMPIGESEEMRKTGISTPSGRGGDDEDTFVSSVSSSFLGHTGSSGIVAIEGSAGSGKTAVLRYLHEMLQHSSSSSSSTFFARYLDCRKILSWKKKSSLDDAIARVVEWFHGVEKGLIERDGGASRSPNLLSPALPHVLIMVDGIDHLFSIVRSYPLLEITFRNALNRFVQSFHDSSSSSPFSSPPSSSRLLVVTSVRPFSHYLPDVLPDITVVLPPLSRMDLQQRVLAQFLITKPEEGHDLLRQQQRMGMEGDQKKSKGRLPAADGKKSRQVETSLFSLRRNHYELSSSSSASLSSIIAQSYPSSMSFRTFLQLTEKALRWCIQEKAAKNGPRGGESTNSSHNRPRPSAHPQKTAVPHPTSSTSASSSVENKKYGEGAVVINWPRPGASIARMFSSDTADEEGGNMESTEEVEKQNKKKDKEKAEAAAVALVKDVFAIENSPSAEYFAQVVHSVSAEMGALYG